MEQWKDIVIVKGEQVFDYTGMYQVSTKGNVRSLNYHSTGQVKELQQVKTKNGYLQVTLSKDNKATKFSVHRLVATAFIPNPDNKPTVNHIDEDKTNNYVENLEWATNGEQVHHGTGTERRSKTQKGKNVSNKTKRKISETQQGHKATRKRKVRCIDTGQEFDTVKQCAEELGVSVSKLTHYLNGRTKTCNGLHFEYV